jgi:type IV pilus assembly protein PilV
MRHMAARIRKTKEEEGITLIEVMVGISLLTFGLLALASMQVTAMRQNAFAGAVTEASTVAGDRLEYLMTLDYDDPEDDTDPLDDVDGDGTDGLDDAIADIADHSKTYNSKNGIQYNLYWNTARDTPSTDNTTIKIIVTWKDHGAQKKVSMKCIVAKIS